MYNVNAYLRGGHHRRHCIYMYVHVKDTALGVLCCFAFFVCLALLASFFLLYLPLTCTCTCGCNCHIAVTGSWRFFKAVLGNRSQGFQKSVSTANNLCSLSPL